ncbi:MAG: YihY/virulence factor BrkB family protein [Balneolaceae bacterium]
MKKLLTDIWEVLKLTFNKAIDDDIVTQGAAIAFYTIFSIAPLFVLVVSVGGLFLNEEMISSQIEGYLGDFLDPAMMENLQQFVTSRMQGDTGIVATIIAAGTLIFGATTVISQLKATLNNIWYVGELKIHSVWNFLLSRLVSFGMIILFSGLLLLSLVAEAALAVIAGFFSDLLPEVQLDLYRYVTQFGTIVFAVLFFTLIFKILPDVHARWLDVMVGAVVTTILFIIGKNLIGVYLTATGIEVTYKTAGSLVIFIIWVYYNVQTILLGAVFTQVYTEKFGGSISPYRFVSLRKQVESKLK